ncbi:MAG TPA: hypothetical protein DCR55_00745 [Lentisphaeria bacterium]|nr:hypothetical protein [Lentisphaeria bacterium]
MRWFAAFALVSLLLLLGLFALAELLQIPVLTPGNFVLPTEPVPVACAIVGLLVLDVVLPVPSGLVMLAAGHQFGVLVGTSLVCLGALLGAVFAWELGRLGGRRLEKVVTVQERKKITRALNRWGMLFIVVTRPVPLVAEVVLLVAGAAAMSRLRVYTATVVGSVIPAVIFTYSGHLALDQDQALWVLFGTISIAVMFWLIGRKWMRA